MTTRRRPQTAVVKRERSDAGGELLIQTRVSEDVLAWMRREADSEALSIAAFLRRLVLRAKDGDSFTRLEARVSELEGRLERAGL
jgi:BMFP domain-containing protein YqiC